MKTEALKERFMNSVLDALYENENSISVTSVGSFAESQSLSAYSDIDVILICDKLTKQYFDICIDILLNINLKDYELENYEILVNSTFGPLKFDKEKLLVIHLMVYDINGHVQHVLKSPFTCLDWERSERFRGVSLREISSVGRLQFNDFISSRRSIRDYSNDLDKNFLSYREYSWEKDAPKEIVKNYSLDIRGKAEFAYHIVKNLIINFYKFKNSKNVVPNRSEIKHIVSNIISDPEEFWALYDEIETAKKLKNKPFPAGVIKWAKNFIEEFENFLFKYKENLSEISFVRHAKTIENDGRFLGIYSNPSIIEEEPFPPFGNFDRVYCSPLNRAVETARMLSKNGIITIDQNLAEINYGLADGLTYSELVKKFPSVKKGWDLGLDPHFPDGENTEDVHLRLINFIKFITTSNVSSKFPLKLCAVTHNVVLRTLIGNAFNMPMQTWHTIKIEHLKEYSFYIIDDKILPNIDRNVLEFAYYRQAEGCLK